MDKRVTAALTKAVEARFDVLGELGEDQNGGSFLARERSGGALVALHLPDLSVPPTAANVAVRRTLDASLPGRAGRCPICRSPTTSWSRRCGACGGDVAGEAGAPDAQALAQAGHGDVELLGEIPRGEGGAPVYFGRDRATGQLLALQAVRATATGAGAAELEVTRLTPAPRPAAGTADVPAVPADEPDLMVCPDCGREYGHDARFCLVDGKPLHPKVQRGELIGRMLANRYRILSQLGEGGMAVVYLAEDIRMGRKCAVKVLKPGMAQNRDSVARFNREAREAGKLDHPNIVAIRDFGESDGVGFLAMEYVPGTTLSTLLKETPGPLPVGRAASIAAQIADALSAAHEKGLVHRDLKPENVLLAAGRGGSDVAKVADFGIAKALNAEGGEALTRTGFVVGTPRYMSPEQLILDKIDGRSDLYALGCVLYEMVTGRPLWRTGYEDYSRRLQQPAPRAREVVPTLPQGLDDLIALSLERNPKDRIQTAQEFRDALTPYVEQRVPAPTPTPTPAPAPPMQAGTPVRPTPAAAAPPPATKLPERPATPASKPPEKPAAAAAKAVTGAPPTPKKPLPRKLVAVGAVGVALIAIVAWVVLRPSRPAPQGAASEVQTAAPPVTGVPSTTSSPAIVAEAAPANAAPTAPATSAAAPEQPPARQAAPEPRPPAARPEPAPAAAASKAPQTKARAATPAADPKTYFADSAAAVVGRFAAAVSSGRMSEVKRVLGLAAEGQDQEWQPLFDANTNIKAVWRPVRADPASVPASFTFILSLTYDHGRELRMYSAAMLPVGGTWKPVSIRRLQ